MRWRPRFSLRTLVVFLLLVTSGVGLWWHWEAWYPIRHVPLRDFPLGKTYASLSPDCRRVAYCSAGRVAIWDTKTGNRLHVLPEEAAGAITLWDPRYSQDGTRIFVIGDDAQGARHVLEWRPETGARGFLPVGDHKELYSAHYAPDGIYSILYSPDGKRWLNDGRDGLMILTDGDSSEWITLPGRGDRCYSARFSHDGARVVCGASVTGPSGDRRCLVRVYDVRQRKLLWVFEDAELIGWAQSAAFTPEGNEIMMASAWGQITTWRRRRPEWWWGVFWLWEFWLTAAFAGLFVWSVVRDRRALGKREAQ